MNFRITVIICASMLAAGCGLIRKVTGGEQRQPEICVEQESRREIPDYVQDTGREQKVRRGSERVSESSQSADGGSSASYTVRHPMHFSGIETEHVRLAAINFFPAGGVELSLDELASEFCYPLCGKFISDYGIRGGRMHTGIDIKAVANDTIRAAFAGVVRMSKNYSGYGNIVVIRHYQGFETAYAHNSKNLVKPNDIVEAGDPIALAGRTGRATTEHLHFEFRAGGDPLDPKLFVDPHAMALRSGRISIHNRKGVMVAACSEAEAAFAADSISTANAEYESARANALAQSTVGGKPKPSSQPDPIYYRVQKNDTLSSIARKHGTSVAKLCELNKIKSTRVLQINQRLRVK